MAATCVLALLGVLGYHLYYYDYGVGRNRSLPPVRPATSDLVTSVEGPAGPVMPGQPCPVTVTLTNATDRRITVADLAGRGGMFDLSLERDGVMVVPKRTGGRLAPWSRDLDAAVDLVPGASYARRIDLDGAFGLTAGDYALTVAYDPEAYFASKGATGKRTADIWLGRTSPVELRLTVSGE